jgi:hypothetical protein
MKCNTFNLYPHGASQALLTENYQPGSRPWRSRVQVWFSSTIQDLIFAKKDLFSKTGLAVCLMW